MYVEYLKKTSTKVSLSSLVHDLPLIPTLSLSPRASLPGHCIPSHVFVNQGRYTPMQQAERHSGNDVIEYDLTKEEIS